MSPLSPLYRLEVQVDQLIAVCQQLRNENKELQKQLHVSQQKQQLLSLKNAQAIQQVKHIIQQLKTNPLL